MLIAEIKSFPSDSFNRARWRRPLCLCAEWTGNTASLKLSQPELLQQSALSTG